VYAYHIRAASEIEGYDKGSANSSVYNFDAEAPASATDDQVRQMFQALLADRFQLKTHRESRPAEQYELSLGKGAPKLTEATSEEPMKVTIQGHALTANAGTCATTGWEEGSHLVCHSATMDQIARGLAGELDARLANATGLTGKYDLNLLYWPAQRPTNADTPLGLTIEQAIGKTLGLKLEKTKVTVEVLVVDHIERPSAN